MAAKSCDKITFNLRERLDPPQHLYLEGLSYCHTQAKTLKQDMERSGRHCPLSKARESGGPAICNNNLISGTDYNEKSLFSGNLQLQIILQLYYQQLVEKFNFSLECWPNFYSDKE